MHGFEEKDISFCPLTYLTLHHNTQYAHDTEIQEGFRNWGGGLTS